MASDSNTGVLISATNLFLPYPEPTSLICKHNEIENVKKFLNFSTHINKSVFKIGLLFLIAVIEINR